MTLALVLILIAVAVAVTVVLKTIRVIVFAVAVLVALDVLGVIHINAHDLTHLWDSGSQTVKTVGRTLNGPATQDRRP